MSLINKPRRGGAREPILDNLLNALRAVAETSRLRLLAACALGEMTVSELTTILGQSQPRVSRHLKVMCDAGLLERIREGSWVFYRLAEARTGTGGALAGQVLSLIPEDEASLARDRARIDQIKQARAERAATYFRANAAQWDDIRSLHIDEHEVERALQEVLQPGRVDDLLDIGTGTGRILELFGPVIGSGVGVDLSREMLAVARANLEAGAFANCQVRQGNMYGLPWDDARFDAVTVHQVLHFADDPAAAINEAARVLRGGGRIAIVDFTPHDREELRVEHAHRRLGFGDEEVADWLRAAGLRPDGVRHLPGEPLTVGLWTARRESEEIPAASLAEAASVIAVEVAP